MRNEGQTTLVDIRQPERSSNTTGIVGLCMVAFAAIFSPTGFCGLPLLLLVPMGFGGLLVCGFSLGWKPRWPGVVGLVIGIGTLIFWGIIFGAPIVGATNQAARFGMNMGQHAQACMSAMVLTEAAESQRLLNGAPPVTFSFSTVPPEYHLDPWGKQYKFTLTGNARGFTFMSDGPDGVSGTADDVDILMIQYDGTFPLPPVSPKPSGL